MYYFVENLLSTLRFMTDYENTVLMLFFFVAELTKESRFLQQKSPLLKQTYTFLKQNMHGSALDALTQQHDRGHFHFSYIQHLVTTFSSHVNKPYVDFKKMLFCCFKIKESRAIPIHVIYIPMTVAKDRTILLLPNLL